MTDGRVEGSLHFHQLRRVELAPHSVPYAVNEAGEFVIDGAGVAGMDGDWLTTDVVDDDAIPDHYGALVSCYCGAAFDELADGREHLETIADVENGVLVRLVEEHGPEYAALAKETARNSRAIGPTQGAREEGLSVDAEHVEDIADRWAAAVEQQHHERLHELRNEHRETGHA